ncbi:TerB family tellurite resistance protein [Photobacterium sp. WH77]|uniref:TerB family tellurite resistance protein n=1 Tax=Photobacterium arenosum TaxID=2774143 RepID=A0ABR9BPL9_9GAMM|nr:MULTISPECIES: TerB family tellurite resistance protein [Photobacterium]MBD8514516.1 TerB family tellurite resistance protein [Photobacterium arenosum]MBV7262376.1 TerB family tellurite resistance protein [Photobacterium sp. WH24]MCG2836268.1 TerB family tellurite resistance protein [Photobacterium sp. WH77]MCG2844105.1 TerB family tellurite resistance protein [Photobacterium sp. WH80]MDO6580532.1 TerB family tellurite resistance protein [Photobacterium sp. 2_MG-2023]
MFQQLRVLFRQVMNEGSDDGAAVDTPSLHLAMASLLCEVADADHSRDPSEESAKVHLLVKLLEVDDTQARALLHEAQTRSEQSVSVFEFTNKLRSLSAEERYRLIEAMWQVAFADGILDPVEEAVIRQVAELIYVDHATFIKAKLSAQAGASE